MSELNNRKQTGNLSLGAIAIIFLGLAIIMGAVWGAFADGFTTADNVPSTEPFGLNNVSSARSEIAITPLAPLDAVLADDKNIVEVSSSNFIYPVSLRIKEIDLNVPVTIVGLNEKNLVTLPNSSAGFWDASTSLAANGNTVIVGHNNLTPAEVFIDIEKVEQGMSLQITSQFASEYAYTIDQVEIFQVEGGDENEYKRIAELMKLEDGSERVTIVSCYPAESCASRIVIIAFPK